MMIPLTYDSVLADWIKRMNTYPEERKGQALFNSLPVWLAGGLLDEDLDPFHNDALCAPALVFIAAEIERLNQEEKKF